MNHGRERRLVVRPSQGGEDKDLKALLILLVKEWESESEVGCINKSALYANQHNKTPSRSTRANSTMSSSQEMQRMDKMILEKEDMQTKISLPPSIDQVMEHSQTTEKGTVFSFHIFLICKAEFECYSFY
ncbi:hypothetical protein MTR67_002449 [Solanum verrucosum]|uniref:Uncharacterized protein n=1 Tax=Solanum verrucosum TaxID=315347 RepID=A0AAF0PW76_SOLVR|nr:hypothetical protein MTR67_002449 [Solanum verrucosum]